MDDGSLPGVGAQSSERRDIFGLDDPPTVAAFISSAAHQRTIWFVRCSRMIRAETAFDCLRSAAIQGPSISLSCHVCLCSASKPFDVMADNIGGGLCGLGRFLSGVEPVFEPAISALWSQVGSGRS
ncbi:MAG: hypothetical protein E5V49_00195 [Mesorhizobium sp.]|nr:hypothetical protein EN848_16650 [bacterium M00.F.Ca.ET.205.01.1.1]TGU52223.1 hypothetical protein EN795_16200 [bacterium M00.F.Ca.ET.152.01.1.1]TGV35097.1 hypothetical protein EN829_017885 [Mesorhizobium sp. M00.F.Ca.ET.186.01.1.1]TGZ43050.1 hypothetical protein EN805_13455 [bacterium M00.F.Ca.ET.162.01.1.1]TIW61922.1 MAG: hypothetical protein E5V48_06795 [Mesorhizobium sp.]